MGDCCYICSMMEVNPTDKVLVHACCAPCSGAILEWLVGQGIRPTVFFSNSNIYPFAEYELRRGELLRYAARLGQKAAGGGQPAGSGQRLGQKAAEGGQPTGSGQQPGQKAAEGGQPAGSGQRPGQKAAGGDHEPGSQEATNGSQESRGLVVIDDTYDHPAWRCAVQGLEAGPERGERCLQCFRFRLERAARYAHEHGFNVLTTTLASSRWKDLAQVEAAGAWACNLFPGLRWWGRNWRKDGLQERRSQIIREQNFYNQTWCGCEFSRF